jgi:hypothetical protein
MVASGKVEEAIQAFRRSTAGTSVWPTLKIVVKPGKLFAMHSQFRDVAQGLLLSIRCGHGFPPNPDPFG